MTCAGCHRPAGGQRVPPRWKRIGDAVYCPACLNQRFVVRTVAMPVVEPLDATWQELLTALCGAWADVTAAANWMMTELYARDVRRQGEGNMPPMASVYLYPEARRLFPGLAPLTIASLEHTAQAWYRAVRYHVIWTHARSLPTFRYPVPLPVHNQLWKGTFVNDRPVVHVRIGDRWWDLRLKGGARYHRQLAAYRQILGGEAIGGELALYRRRAHEGPLLARPNGNQRAAYAIACKIAAWLPRAQENVSRQESSALRVETRHDALLVAVDPNDVIWRYHGDHLRRWSAEYRKACQHFADDHKGGSRMVPLFVDRRTTMAVKHQHRMRSAVQEAAAHVTDHAKRRHCSRITYDDSVRAFCPDFPFAALRERLRWKCDEAGIAFEYANDNDISFAGPPVGPARSPAGAHVAQPLAEG